MSAPFNPATDSVMDKPHEASELIDTLKTELTAGIAAIQKIVDCWSHGDLANAVNEAEDWATNASELLDDEVQS